MSLFDGIRKRKSATQTVLVAMTGIAITSVGPFFASSGIMQKASLIVFFASAALAWLSGCLLIIEPQISNSDEQIVHRLRSIEFGAVHVNNRPSPEGYDLGVYVEGQKGFLSRLIGCTPESFLSSMDNWEGTKHGD